MLEAIYHTRVTEDLTSNLGYTTYVIDESPLPDGMNFEVTAYSKCAGYTLIQWSLGDELERMTGETLWQGQKPILNEAGELTLYLTQSPDSKRLLSLQPEDIWEQYAQSEVQISDAIGMKLRNNFIYL